MKQRVGRVVLHCTSSAFDVVKGAALETSSNRVLVVEDSKEFRKFICSMLGERPELQIVGEVTDGLQAIQKAENCNRT